LLRFSSTNCPLRAASRHLELLKAIAQRAVISAASGTGTKLVSALLKSWPF